MSVNNLIKIEEIKNLIPKRNKLSHKGNYGRVLVVAGLNGMPGAAFLSSLAALRTGSGLVYVCTNPNNFTAINTLAPEVICVDWQQAGAVLSGKSEWNYNSVAFGPGMGTGLKAKNILKSILLTYTGTLVLDADGLNILALDETLKSFAQNYLGDLIITPHMGEANRLLNLEKEGVDNWKKGSNKDEEDKKVKKSREEIAVRLTAKYNAISVLKGSGTLVSYYKSNYGAGIIEIAKNTNGNPGMATAGSGDVLTGIILSLTGQGLTPSDSAKAGVYIHGLAGDMALEDKGEYGMIARDILGKIPYSIKQILEFQN